MGVIDHTEEFDAHNKGAHPRSPPRLSAPALNWHFAFWHRNDDQGSFIALLDLLICMFNSSPTSRKPGSTRNSCPSFKLRSLNGQAIVGKKKSIHVQLGDFYLERVDGFWQYKSVTNVTRNALTAKEANPFNLGRLACALLWGGQLVKIGIEVHGEFVTVTFWLPAYMAKGKPRSHTAASDEPSGTLCKGNFAKRLRRQLALCMSDLELRPGDVMPTATRSAAAVSPQQQLYETIWNDFVVQSGCAKQFQRISAFADFRSIILPTQAPFCKRDGYKETGDPRFNASTASSKMESIEKRMEADGRAELSGSLFLNRRVVYASSLSVSTADASPTARFLMITQPMSRWQLGRLVERLNMLGTYRLASLRNLSFINAASGSMRQLGERMVTFEQNLPDDLAEFSKKLQELYRSFAESSAKIDGGLNYRIDRSRYYVDSFNRTLPDLRIGRIEGFQPYDEFITRRYGAVWDRISRVGERYARLAKRLDFLSGQLNALEQREQTKNVADQTREQTKLLHAAHNVEYLVVIYYSAQIVGGAIALSSGLALGNSYHVFALFLAPFALLGLPPSLLVKDHVHGTPVRFFDRIKRLRPGWTLLLVFCCWGLATYSLTQQNCARAGAFQHYLEQSTLLRPFSYLFPFACEIPNPASVPYSRKL